jgi:iron complex transport system substrate-binding protein
MLPLRLWTSIALALLPTLPACSSSEVPSSEPFGLLNEEFPLRIRSWDGEVITLSAPAQHVLPLNSTAVDELSVLIAPGRVRALPHTAVEYSTLREDPAAWRALPEFSEITAPGLLALEPDLVIAHEWQGASAIPHLRRAGIAVLVLPMPDSLEAACAELALLGQLLDAPERAEEVIAEVQARRQALAASAAERAGLRVLSYANYGTGGWAAGAGTTPDIVIGLAGMQNVAREADLTSFAEIDYELLLRLDPDLILVEAEESGEPGPTESLLRNEPALTGLRALQTDGIARLPRRLSATTSFHMIEAAELLARETASWKAAQD